MKNRPKTVALGAGLLALAFASGMGAWALVPQAQPGAAAGQAAGKGGGEAADGEVVIKLAEAPEAVRAAVAKVTPAASVTRVLKEEDEGVTIYEVEFTEGGMSCSASFSAAGETIDIEKGVKESALPAAATAALKKSYPAATFGGHTAVQEFFYEVEITINGTKHEVRVNAAGDIEDETADADDEHDEDGDDDGKGAKPEGKQGEKDDDDD